MRIHSLLGEEKVRGRGEEGGESNISLFLSADSTAAMTQFAHRAAWLVVVVKSLISDLNCVLLYETSLRL